MPGPITLAKPPSHLLAATAWMVGGLLSFSSLAVVTRELLASFHPFQIQFLRSLIGFGIMLALTLGLARIPAASRQWGMMVTRNIFHIGGQVLWTMGIGLLPLALVFALEFTSPIWATFMAMAILGERLTPGRGFAVLTGFLGILVVVRPGVAAFDPNILLVLVAAIFFGFTNIATKRLTRTDTPSCIVFWMCAMQTLMLLPFAVAVWRAPILADLPLILLLGSVGLSAHYCLSRALSLADAITVLPMEYLRLPLIGLTGAAFYAEPLDPWIYGGSALIFTGIYVNLRQEQRRQRQDLEASTEGPKK